MTPSKLKNAIEHLFENLGHKLYQHRIKTFLIMTLLIGLLTSQMPPVIDTSTEAMLRADDPGKINYDPIPRQFL